MYDDERIVAKVMSIRLMPIPRVGKAQGSWLSHKVNFVCMRLAEEADIYRM